MRIALLSVLFVVFASSFSFGQATTSNCPTIEVIGPAGVTRPDEEMTFVASFSSSGPNFTFQWAVEEGTITEGQGTPIIKVKGVTDGVTVKATVSIGGLSSNCANSAWERGPVDQRLPQCSLDSWGNLSPNEVRAKMDIFFAELSNNPKDIGVISLNVKENQPLNANNKRLLLIKKHAIFRDFDLSRIVFNLELSEIEQTTLWRVPPGAEMPCPKCIAINGRDLK